jgi:pimeloyl-ACP methyl ester carboxylesterase
MNTPSKLVMSFAFIASALCACTSNQEQFSNSVEIESSDGIGKVVEAQAQQGMSAKQTDGYSIEWFSCTRNVKAPYVIMLNPKDSPFKTDACRSGLVQAFLQQDYNVVAVNRPGVGQSEGKELIGDDQSLRSIEGLIKAQRDAGKTIDGIWGFEEASVLAFRIAKSMPFKMLIVGNGIYDWEALLSEGKDPSYVSEMKKLQSTGDSRFAEQRSIAWDFAGLPKSVYLYQMQGDPHFPATQAEAFRAALAANQYGVKLIELRDEKANLTPMVHQSVLMQIAQLEKPQAL